MSSGEHDTILTCGIDWMRYAYICVVEQACGHCTELRSTHPLGHRPLGMQRYNCYRCSQQAHGEEIHPDYHVHAPDTTLNGPGAEIIMRPSLLNIEEFKEVLAVFETIVTEDQESL